MKGNKRCGPDDGHCCDEKGEHDISHDILLPGGSQKNGNSLLPKLLKDARHQMRIERTARKESWKETSKREGGEKRRMRKAARARVCSRFLSRLSKIETRKVMTMMADRTTEIPPPAMKA